MISLPTLVWAIYIGLVIGTLVMYYNKSILGKAVRAILAKNAIGEEGALSAKELGFEKNPFVMHSIEKGALGRYIHRKKADGREELLYYITEEDRVRAELRYSNKGTDLYVVIIALVLFTIVAFVAARYLPELIDMAKNLAS